MVTYGDGLHYISQDLTSLEKALPTDVVISFGRQDPLVAHKTAQTLLRNIASFAIISGGTGKDSSTLAIPEATYICNILRNDYPQLSGRYLEETTATNGYENSVKSLEILADVNPHANSVTLVGHYTSLRRLLYTFLHAATNTGSEFNRVQAVPTDYIFNEEKREDANEILQEILNMHTYPTRYNWRTKPEGNPALFAWALKMKS